MSFDFSGRYTALLGAPNNKGVQVSQALATRGISLLRQMPSDSNLMAIPDMNQPGYGTYKTHLPHFIHAMTTHARVSLVAPCAVMNNSLESIPICWPKLAISWDHPIAQDSIEALKGAYSGEDYTHIGRAGLLLKIESLDDVRDVVRGYSPSRVANSPIETVNIHAIQQLAHAGKLAALFLSLHRYPAFSDEGHLQSFSTWVGDHQEPGRDVTMGVAVVHASGEYTNFGQRVSLNSQQQRYVQGDQLPNFDINEAIITDASTISRGGIWFPYVSDLALYDGRMVPKVIERYFLGSLAGDVETCLGAMESIRSGWGVCGQTEGGKRMSHLYAGIAMSIEAQCVCRPLFENSVYLGFCLQGAGFTIEINKRQFRPGSASDLRNAISTTGSNVAVFQHIASVCGVALEEREDWNNIRTMWQLRRRVFGLGLTEDQKRGVIESAKMLRLEQMSWKANPEDFDRAARFICDAGYMEDWTEERDTLPIHPSYLFSTDPKAVVWSCFGAVAPSFRIQGGTKIALDGDLMYTRSVQAGRGGVQKEKLRMNEVAVQFVVLEKAVEDLKTMIAEKSILNPLAMAERQKRSARNQYKFFYRDNALTVVGHLRRMCRITEADIASGSGKRRLGDDFEEGGPAKKRATALDFF